MRGHIGAFPHHQAVLVDYAIIGVHIGISVLDFRDIADRPRTGPAREVVVFAALRRDKVRLVVSVVFRHGAQRRRRSIYRAHAARRMILRGHIGEIYLPSVPVVGVGDHHAPVLRRALRHHDHRAGLGARAQQRKHRRARNQLFQQKNRLLLRFPIGLLFVP